MGLILFLFFSLVGGGIKNCRMEIDLLITPLMEEQKALSKVGVFFVRGEKEVLIFSTSFYGMIHVP
jgi:hypothetical protein